MKSHSSCFPCFMKQAYSSVMHALPNDEDRRWDVLREISQLLPGLKVDDSPAYNSSLILHVINEQLDITDPYAQAKKDSNQKALAMVPALMARIKAATDRFETAVRLAVVGNVIDLGIQHEANLDETVEQALGAGFARFDYPAFKEQLAKAQRILYVLDNAGEIVFDRILIEGLRAQKKMVVAAVKSGPILNDATMEDAKAVGMDKVARMIETGSNYVGAIRDKCSETFNKVADSADMIIAKGQGNFETMEGFGPKSFFILKAKCDHVAESLGVKLNDLVLAQG